MRQAVAMRENRRIGEATPDDTLAKTRFPKLPNPRIHVSKQNNLTCLVPAGNDESFERFANYRVILEEDRTGQTLVDDLSIGQHVAERTGQFSIGKLPERPIIVPRPRRISIHLGVGPVGQAVTPVDTDQDLGLEAHFGERFEQWRAAGLVALQGEDEDGPMVFAARRRRG